MKVVAWITVVAVVAGQILATWCAEDKMVSAWWVGGSLLVLGVVYAILYERMERKTKEKARTIISAMKEALPTQWSPTPETAKLLKEFGFDDAQHNPPPRFFG